ncbi:MAG: hypothetical protein NXI04_13840 [Planctomycetaceae bacterium]|nr:hypothetical protein [Planctomycetaceae bacterium]
MKTDDPFAPPQPVTHTEAREFADGSFRLEGDLLVCGAEADLTAVCWYSGELTTPEDRKNTSRVRLEHVPMLLRMTIFGVSPLIVPLDTVLTDQTWIGLSWLLLFTLTFGVLFLVQRSMPVTRVTLVYTHSPRPYRRKRWTLVGMHVVLAACIASYIAPLLPIGDLLIRFIVSFSFVIMPLWLLWDKVTPPSLHVRFVEVYRYSRGVFRIKGVPPQFLDGVRRLQSQDRVDNLPDHTG